MSKVYTGSPVPLRKSDSDPLFKLEDDGYTVRKSYSPMERQRMADGTLHSMNRPSAVAPKDYDLYISEDKVSKSKKEEDKSLNVKKRNPDEIIKHFMKAQDCDDEEREEADDISKNKPKLGSGKRFEQLSNKLDKKGVKDPDAVAAAIGRKKYGKAKFQKLAAKGK